MQWQKKICVGAVLVAIAVPATLGCEQRQQVRPEVIEPQTPEGRMELDDADEETDVNIGVRNEDQ